MTLASTPAQQSCEETERLCGDVLDGLMGERKALPCKYFYDETGSLLFEQITQLEEYYPTRTELSIMESHAREIADSAGRGCVLIEPGAGSARKTRLLLSQLREPAGYIPIEISAKHLSKAVRELREGFPRLQIHPVYADFLSDFELPACGPASARKVAYFPGSTIGNLHPEAAAAFLRRLSGLCGDHGGLIVGVDLKKDTRILERAYNDARGVTARFNLNLLARLNRELGADFQLSRFAHHAFYNPEHGRIEMHLLSMADQAVHIRGRRIRFEIGETIHTENCYKYSLDDFRGLAARAGLRVLNVWTDTRRFFSVQYLTS